MKRLVESGLLAVMVLLLADCATAPGPVSAPLLGMVYNLDRLPVSDVAVRWLKEGKPVASGLTDIRGRFSLPEIPFGPVTLEFTKDTYEPVTWTLTFHDSSQVVYMKMEDSNELLDEAGNAVEKREWESALGYLDRVEKLLPRSRVSQYLRGLVLAGQGKAAEAATLLETLSAQDSTSFPLELTLADLYQYKIGDLVRALTHLKRALTVKRDADVEKRIAGLSAQ